MNLDHNVSQFIKNHQVGVLAIAGKEGAVHAAAMHYSMREEPLKLFFATPRHSRKGQLLAHHHKLNAAVVIGASPEEWATIQLDGELKVLTDPDQLEIAKSIHYLNNPESRARNTEPETLMLVFTPTWWRYTNFQANPAVVISSEPDSELTSDPDLLAH